jgi:hypothetical protein
LIGDGTLCTVCVTGAVTCWTVCTVCVTGAGTGGDGACTGAGAGTGTTGFTLGFFG